MKYLVIFFVLSILYVSCNKNDSNPLTTSESNATAADYFPLSAGNYWIYEFYSADSTLNFTDQNTIDSIYIEKDTLINGQTYKVLKSSLFQSTTFVRDSSDYVVSGDGVKLFSLNSNNGTAFEQYYPGGDSSFIVSWKMMISDSIFICPNAQYLSKYAIGTVNSTNNSQFKERTVFRVYAKNIGMVGRRANWLYSGIYDEWKLIRYKVNN
jgi:hypothetical protein